MGGKCPFGLFVGLLSSDESVQSRSVCRTEAGVFHSICWHSRYFYYLCTQNQTSKDMGQKEDIEKVTSKIILIRDTQVIIDRDVAELYGVTTREINQALKNNPRKFPSDFVIELTNSEKQKRLSKILITSKG